MQIIGDRLRSLRKDRGLTQVQMAQMLNVQQSRINRYESGASTPGPDVFIQLADFFDVSMDYLYGRCDDPRGKLYGNQAKELTLRAKLYGNQAKELTLRAKQNPEMEQFIEMLFDPTSPASGKVKEALLRILREEEKP